MNHSRLSKRYLPVFLGFLVLFSLACNLTGNLANSVVNKVGNAVTGSGDAGTVATLWADVPQMSGLKQENLALPIGAKLALQTVMRTTTGGSGQLNFIAFTTPQSPQEVVNYYTVDRMTKAGWNQSDQMGCESASAGNGGPSSIAGGGFCLFAKDAGNQETSYLGIFIGQDSVSKLTQVFFMRVDAQNQATPTATGG